MSLPTPTLAAVAILLLVLGACASRPGASDCPECDALRDELAHHGELHVAHAPVRAGTGEDPATEADDELAMAPATRKAPVAGAGSGAAAHEDALDVEQEGADDSWRRFTQVNLHPDPQRRRLYAANYQQGGLIPAGTEVEILSQTRKRMRFRVVESGEEYEYLHHAAAAEPLADHLDEVFGRTWQPVLEDFSDIDRQGIEQGQPLEGMSKAAILIAMGRPPKHETPDLTSDRWRYWTHRFNSIAVLFDEQGLMAGIEE